MSIYQQAQSPLHSSRRDTSSSYEAQRPTWDSRQSNYHPHPPPSLPPPQHHFHPQPRSDSRPEPPSHFWDEEGSDSDVSRTVDPRETVNRILSPVAAPRQLPPIASPHALTALDAVQARLDELERIDDHNAQKLKRLEAKRHRKDERINRRRAMEDEKIRSVREARVRKDERIRSRRAREDDLFRGADKQLGVEELDLRRRLRSLKRGLPVEDGRPDGGSASAASMSPPLSQSHGTAPPPKRHQSGPPGQNGSPAPPPVARPVQHSPASQYHFYQPPPPGPPYPVPIHHGPQPSYNPYHAPPSTMYSSVPAGSAASPRPSNIPVDTAPPRTNGFVSTPSPVVPGPLPAPSGPIDTRPPPPGPSPYAAPTYDTRPPPPPPPPPPTTTGFTSVNAGQVQTSGFATVNPRPMYTTSPPPKLTKERSTPKSEGHRRGSGKSPKNTTPIAVGGLTLNKRTPSTTHPYQMSEAFANRHHHCERTDELNRGIWTSYGYMGSQDVPTGPAVEMYLRCNHDNCKRIDWRTVHGLQCHIVKNHGQPKGTIGSLEKALALYGVPINEVVDYEKLHGLGSAGQMADPKNQKIKNKTREAMHKSESPGSGDMSTPTLTPSASYTSSANPRDGSLLPQTPSRGTSGEKNGLVTDLGASKSVADWSGPGGEAPARPNNSFVAVRNTWSSYVPPAAITKTKESTLPTSNSAQDPGPPEQLHKPAAVQEKMQLTPNTPSGVNSIAEITVETPGPKQTEEMAPRSTTDQAESSANMRTELPTVPPAKDVESTKPVPTADAAAEPPKEEEVETENQITVITAPAPAATAQIDKEVIPPVEQPTVSEETKPADTVPESSIQVTTAPGEVPTTPQQPPPTPSRRPSRRESIVAAAVSKSAQKEQPESASTMQSPKVSKTTIEKEGKKVGRRASVAISTASVSASVSVDGDGEREREDGGGEEGEKAEKGGDNLKGGESKETTTKASSGGGSRRNATGRVLRKGR